MLLRQLSEKYSPAGIVVFVALQAASMTSQSGPFLSARPDLAHGRARLDELWLVRGDCVQVELRPRRGTTTPRMTSWQTSSGGGCRACPRSRRSWRDGCTRRWSEG